MVDRREEVIYRFWEARVDIIVANGERKTGSKTPPPIQTVDAPEKLVSANSLVSALGVCKGGIVKMQAQFEGYPRGQTDCSPCKDILVAVKVVETLVKDQHNSLVMGLQAYHKC